MNKLIKKEIINLNEENDHNGNKLNMIISENGFIIIIIIIISLMIILIRFS
jgi:hypothetical protein